MLLVINVSIRGESSVGSFVGLFSATVHRNDSGTAMDDAVMNSVLGQASRWNANWSCIFNHRYLKKKGPDNPTSQLLPIISMKGCSRDGERRLGERRRWRIEKLKQLWVTKWNVKDGVCVCVTQQCVKDGVCESCVWKRVCDKVVCERWCVTKWCVKDGVAKDGRCVTKLCVKDGVVKDGVWQSGVWRMVCWKMVWVKVLCEREHVTKLCVKDGVWQSAVWKMVCQRWCVTKLGVKDGVWKMVCYKAVCDGV